MDVDEDEHNVEDEHSDQDRRRGMLFEQFCRTKLERMVTGKLPANAGLLHRSLHGAQLFGRWVDVPAWVLANIKYLGYGPNEHYKIMNGPREQRGFSERGGDKMIVRKDGSLIVVQDKDHANFST
eukprot:5376646-Prymnesium_polylepis.1